MTIHRTAIDVVVRLRKAGLMPAYRDSGMAVGVQNEAYGLDEAGRSALLERTVRAEVRSAARAVAAWEALRRVTTEASAIEQRILAWAAIREARGAQVATRVLTTTMRFIAQRDAELAAERAVMHPRRGRPPKHRRWA